MKYTEKQYIESASIQARIIDELNAELKALKKVNEAQAEQLTTPVVMQRFQDFINEYEDKITKEQAIINGLDPIETCDDVLYELKIMRDALNKCYKQVFNVA